MSSPLYASLSRFCPAFGHLGIYPAHNFLTFRSHDVVHEKHIHPEYSASALRFNPVAQSSKIIS
jgi:hypothetical protein